MSVSFTVRPPPTHSDDDTGIVFPGAVPADDEHSDSDSDDLAVLSRPAAVQPRPKRKQPPPVLVIPTKPNPDWREAARKRRAACPRGPPSFVPRSAATGVDGSVGGLGTRGTINSGPQLVGLHVHTETPQADDEQADAAQPAAQVAEESEDQKALRAILAGEDEPVVEVIPVPPLSEADALRQDVEELPDVATADDYERVPISAFGAAMLRGMGWTGGAVAPKKDKRSKNALSQPYLPSARPALLGIGAKEREPDDDGSGKKRPKGRDMRYVPVVRTDSDRGEGGSSRSGTVSRRHSPSRRDRDSDRDRRRTRDDESTRREKDYDGRDRRGDRNGRDYDERDRRDRRDRGRDDSYSKRYDERDRTRERDRRNR